MGLQRFLADVLVEVNLGRQLDAPDVVAEVDAVQIGLEDLILVVSALHVQSRADFLQLSFDILSWSRRMALRATCMVMVLPPSAAPILMMFFTTARIRAK